MAEKRPTLVLGIMGWVVAALSLAINGTNLYYAREDRLRKEGAEPTFVPSIKTYDPAILPRNFLALDEETPHEFSLRHRSGRQVENLTVEFSSPDKLITRIEIIEGKPDANASVSPGGHEGTIDKKQLLQGTTMKGYVYTRGLTAVKMVANATKGEVFAEEPPKTDSGRASRWLLAFVIVCFAGMVVSAAWLGIQARPQLEESGLLSTEGRSSPLLWLLVAVTFILSGLSSILRVPTVSDLTSAFLLYFLITRYRLIISVMESLAARTNEAPCNRRAVNEEPRIREDTEAK